MKTHSIEWTSLENRRSLNSAGAVTGLQRTLCAASDLFIAAVPALAIVVAAAWLASDPALAVFLQAALWASGFLFFGLAIDARSSHVIPLLASGFALPVLALLSRNGTLELAIVAAAIIASWVGFAIYRSRN
jgi:hypothetical protein